MPVDAIKLTRSSTVPSNGGTLSGRKYVEGWLRKLSTAARYDKWDEEVHLPSKRQTSEERCAEIIFGSSSCAAASSSGKNTPST